MAVRGRRGEIEATDYRGVPVVAALRAVRDTPWFIIAKVDQKEVYVTFRRQLARTALLVGVLLLAVVLGVSLLWYRHGLVAAEREIVLQARLRRILDADIIGAVIAGEDGEVFEANDYYLRLIGVTREEFQRQPVDWHKLTPPEWAGADEIAIRELRERGTCTPYEKEYIRSDGTRVPVLLVDALLPGPEHHIAAFVLDLTERKTIEAELESLARQRQLALDAAGMGWWTYDSASQSCSLDERTAEIFGLSLSDVHIDDILQRVHHEDRPRLRAALRDAAHPRHPHPYSIECRVRADDGSSRWVEAHGAATAQEQGSVRLVGTLQDITERKRAEVALAERIEELRRWHEATLGRENRILEIKQEVNELLARAGLPPRYASPGIRTGGEEPAESEERRQG
jgi:PAS domain S-box-containing protein